MPHRLSGLPGAVPRYHRFAPPAEAPQEEPARSERPRPPEPGAYETVKVSTFKEQERGSLTLAAGWPDTVFNLGSNNTA